MTEHPLRERIAELDKRKDEAPTPARERSVERQHAKGKMLARERIEYLLDDEGRPYTDGVITGWAPSTAARSRVLAGLHGLRRRLGEVFAEKIHKLHGPGPVRSAPHRPERRRRRPHPGGRRLLDSYGGIFYRNVLASGVTPQISVIMGPCAGGAVYSPGDDRLHLHGQETAHVHHRPRRGEDGDRRGRHPEELGGAMSHATKSGVAPFVADERAGRLDDVKYLLSYLPSNNLEGPPWFAPDDPDRPPAELYDLMPASPNQPYDMHQVVARPSPTTASSSSPRALGP